MFVLGWVIFLCGGAIALVYLVQLLHSRNAHREYKSWLKVIDATAQLNERAVADARANADQLVKQWVDLTAVMAVSDHWLESGLALANSDGRAIYQTLASRAEVWRGHNVELVQSLNPLIETGRTGAPVPEMRQQLQEVNHRLKVLDVQMREIQALTSWFGEQKLDVWRRWRSAAFLGLSAEFGDEPDRPDAKLLECLRALSALRESIPSAHAPEEARPGERQAINGWADRLIESTAAARLLAPQIEGLWTANRVRRELHGSTAGGLAEAIAQEWLGWMLVGLTANADATLMAALAVSRRGWRVDTGTPDNSGANERLHLEFVQIVAFGHTQRIVERMAEMPDLSVDPDDAVAMTFTNMYQQVRAGIGEKQRRYGKFWLPPTDLEAKVQPKLLSSLEFFRAKFGKEPPAEPPASKKYSLAFGVWAVIAVIGCAIIESAYRQREARDAEDTLLLIQENSPTEVFVPDAIGAGTTAEAASTARVVPAPAPTPHVIESPAVPMDVTSPPSRISPGGPAAVEGSQLPRKLPPRRVVVDLGESMPVLGPRVPVAIPVREPVKPALEKPQQAISRGDVRLPPELDLHCSQALTSLARDADVERVRDLLGVSEATVTGWSGVERRPNDVRADYSHSYVYLGHSGCTLDIDTFRNRVVRIGVFEAQASSARTAWQYSSKPAGITPIGPGNLVWRYDLAGAKLRIKFLADPNAKLEWWLVDPNTTQAFSEADATVERAFAENDEAQFRERVKEFDVAENHYKKAVAICANYTRAWLRLCKLQKQMGKRDDAIESCEHATEANLPDVKNKALRLLRELSP